MGGGQSKLLATFDGFRCLETLKVSKSSTENKKGFTLAEVLITLGIIGVVAAMTIPTLVQHYQDHVLDTQKKKSSSELSQAFKMMLAHNEVDSLVNVPIMKCGEDSDCIRTEIGKVLKIVNDNNISALPEKYEFADKEETVWDGYDIKYVFTSPNGATYGIVKMDEDAENVSIIADVNGNKRPNKGAVDLCLFNITKQGIANIDCSALKNAETRIACKPGAVSGCAEVNTCLDNGGVWADYWIEHENRKGCFNDESAALNATSSSSSVEIVTKDGGLDVNGATGTTGGDDEGPVLDF